MTSKCHVCHGDKTVKSVDELTLFIEKGIQDGHEYVIWSFNNATEIQRCCR